MKEHNPGIWAEITKSMLRDYFITAHVSKLEERLRKVEEKSEPIYKSTNSETYWPKHTDKEYKNMDLNLPIDEKQNEYCKWQDELDFFNNAKKTILKNSQYRNKFVAIKNQKVIDSDKDKFRLVKRINKKYPDEAVLVVKVQIAVPRLEVPSPELVL